MPVTTTKPVDRMTVEEMKARIQQLEDEKTKTQTLMLKVAPKGGISLYGLGRWPVTLYWEQWVKLFAAQDKIKAFAEANKDKLTTKADKIAADATAA